MGSGSKRLRGETDRAGHWELRFYAGVDPVSAKKRWVNRTFHGGKHAAHAALRKLVAEVEEGDRPSDVTAGALLDEWLVR